MLDLPVRLRLALVSAGLVATLLVVLGALVYVRLEADLIAAVDDELATRADDLLDDPDLTLEVAATDVGDVFAQRLDRAGRLLATSPGLVESVVPSGTALDGLDDPRVIEAEIPTPGELVLARLLLHPADDGTVLVVGVTVDDQRAALATLVFQLLFMLPLAMILAGAVGWIVAGAALRPVERMRVEAEAISGSEPDRRLPVPRSRDELAALGTSLNRMLDRLQDAVERERRFVDDASHELRTPLANLKAELELGLRRSRTRDELLATLHSAADETDRLARLAEDLLVLARTDRGRLPIRRERVDVTGVVREAVDRFAARAAAERIELVVVARDGVMAEVDRMRLDQAVGNLVDNALRHASPGSRVTVTLRLEDDGLTLVVADTGAGFPATFLPHAFEAFSRADPARSSSHGGAGLGLAIVRAVAEAHGGSAEARNRHGGGGEVVLRLPV